MKGVVKYTKMNALVVGRAQRRPVLPPVAVREGCQRPSETKPIAIMANKDLHGRIVKSREALGSMGSRNESMDNGVCERTRRMQGPIRKHSDRSDDPYLSVSLGGVT